MNGPSSQLLTSAAVFRGELGRILIALGIVLLILAFAWAIEEWRVRKVVTTALGWFGIGCLALLALFGAALVWVGLL